MKAIILAAGQGNRLKPLTLNKPKCLVELHGKPIVDYILSVFESCGIDDVSIVTGFKREVLKSHLSGRKIKLYFNKRFETTNMVSTFFCAKKELNSDVIISYADIVYSKKVLQKLMKSKADISVVVDKKWKKLWDLRGQNPLETAETMKVNSQGHIVELGKKPNSYREIRGQYIGLIKISKKAVSKIKKFYGSLDKKAIYDGKPFDLMYMTSFIQQIIDWLMPVKAVFINGGWVEVDSLSDLKAYEQSGFLPK